MARNRLLHAAGEAQSGETETARPQTVLALFFGIMASVMLAGAIMVRFLPGPLGRFRARYRERHPRPEPGETKRTVPPAPARPKGPPRAPPAPAPAVRTGPGRSL